MDCEYIKEYFEYGFTNDEILSFLISSKLLSLTKLIKD